MTFRAKISNDWFLIKRLKCL